MSRSLSVAFAFGAFASTLTACQGTRQEALPIHFVQNMDFQQKFEAQEENPFFADGRAARPPIEGTVARGQLKDNEHFYGGRGLDGRLSDELPEQVTLDAALLDRGEERYDIYCAACHDGAGTGHGIATQRGGGFKVQPPSYHQDKYRAMPIGYFYDVISNGKGTMLPYAAQIPEADRWAIAVYVRTLQVHGKREGWNHEGGVVPSDFGKPTGKKQAEPKAGER